MHQRKKKKSGGLVVLLIVAIMLLLCLAIFLVFRHFYGLLNVRDAADLSASPAVSATLQPSPTPEETPDPSAKIVSSDEAQSIQDSLKSSLADNPVAQKGVYNVLLLGADSRANDYNSRTDTMMLVTINSRTKKIVLSSFLRDTYIYIPDWGYQRLNVANEVGGPAKTIETIQQNYNVAIDNYAFVNFYSFMDAVDILGGVDLPLTDEEVYYINMWVYDEDLEVDYSRRTSLDYRSDGQYHLNGIQALAYCRTRNIGADIGRTERQRNMMGILWDKAQDMSLSTLSDLAETILPQITTDIPEKTCLSLLASMASYKDYELVSQQVPADGTFNFVTIDEMSVLTADMAANQELLQKSLYGEG